jgi:repressor LexA
MTLQELAATVGCSKAYLSALENDKLGNPPKVWVIQSLETALGVTAGELVRLADWQRTPARVRAEVEQLTARSRRIAAMLREAPDNSGSEQRSIGRNLDQLYRSGELQRALDDHAANVDRLAGVCFQVPLINKVAAGYPTEFTDLAYPARVADEYVSVPEVNDPDAFAARVCGQSMLPDYRQGDIIVYSPNRDPKPGDDCFVRLLPDHHTTFKRVYFEDGDRIRLQPLNPEFAPQTLDRDQIDGIYPAVYRVQKLGG